MVIRILLFLIINFGALAIGGIFTGKGVPSEWYANLNKAPWTPPGWVFGAAWTTIMLCFSIYLAMLWPKVGAKQVVLSLFIVQWLLNVSWNPVFFYWHQIGLGLIVIVLLTVVVGYIFIKYWGVLKGASLLLLPYVLWLCIATSLNAYIYLKN